MCAEHPKKRFLSLQSWIGIALLLGIFSSLVPFPGQQSVAEVILSLFTSALKFVSLPTIFLALVTTIIGFKERAEFNWLAKRVVSWTLLTTVIAATIALALFLLLNPVSNHVVANETLQLTSGGWFKHLLSSIPSNPIQPFLEGNVLGVLVIAIAVGLSLLAIPGKDKVHDVLNPMLGAMMRLVRALMVIIPFTVWAAIVTSFNDLTDGAMLRQLGLYLAVVVGANLLQAFVVIPLLLKLRGMDPFSAMKRFMPALTVAFFSKSSVATMPVAIKTAEEQMNIRPEVSRFVFPICTTINMNGCAAFILATVLFVSMQAGMTYTPFELIGWIGVATIAAVGNAGVPMGCYFLSSALLAGMNMPLGLMGLILPFYSFIDMLETAINVWSDGAVAMLVNDQKEKSLACSL